MNLINLLKFRRATMRIALLILLCLTTASAQDQEDATPIDSGEGALPELGDQAARIFSPQREQKIGQQFVRELIRGRMNIGTERLVYLSDPELNAYFSYLGEKISENAHLRGGKISVHLVSNPKINAFAFPGGHITFYSGLFFAADDENELASVMAHEIAHLTQRHIPRKLAKAQSNQLPAVAAVFASIIVGGQTGLAGLTLTQAVMSSTNLAYSREFEREADAVGIKLLAESGFDQNAMASFFKKLETFGGIGEVEFLRTHPLSYTRIAAAESRAASYPPANHRTPRTFHYMQAKMRALYSTRPQNELKYFQSRAKKTKGDKRIAALYGEALTLAKLRRFDEAQINLRELLDIHPKDIALQNALAYVLQASGSPKAAAQIYGELHRDNPSLDYLARYHATALLTSGDAAAAKRVLRRQLRSENKDIMLYPILSKSNAKLGLLAEANQASAEFHIALGENQQAISSLNQALRASKQGSYLHTSLSARLKEITRLQEIEQQK